jgi:thiol-disulfide isomerase/thioredoxin
VNFAKAHAGAAAGVTFAASETNFIEINQEKTMLTRRSILGASILGAVLAAGTLAASPAFADNAHAFDVMAFAAAQKAGKPILIAVHASWCPTCKAQAPILSDLRADPRFKDLVYFVVDFDSQKDLLNRFGVRTQSTLIVFKGEKEEARSVGDTRRESIFAMVGKAL